jgi:transcription-repair coupling factor (superfamily II helicase)
MISRLRADCHRIGLRDITINSNQARLAPIQLKTSEAMRLKRLSRDALVKDELKQIVVPIKRGVDPATFLVSLLRELIPVVIEPVGSSS